MEVAVADFQSYREEQRIPLERHLTLLAGRNNVGKSALLRALSAFIEPQEGAGPGFALTITLVVDGQSLAAPHRMEPSLAGLVRAYAEHNEHTITATLVSQRDDDFIGPLDQMYVSRIELRELGWTVAGEPGHSAGWVDGLHKGASTAVPELERVIRDYLSSVRYLAPARIEPGPRSLRADVELAQEARNLPEVLFHLYNSDPRRYQQIMEVIRRAFPEIEAITVAPVPGESMPMGETKVLYVGRDEHVPLRHCGTGVELFLRFAVAVHEKRSRLLLIDEPQAFLHPHAERELLRLVDQHEEHQYVIATHSHVLLNARPLNDARLVTMDGGASRVTVPSAEQEVLSEVGLTAGDIGLAEHLVWVEGPADEEAFRVLLQRTAGQTTRNGIVVKPMPVAASQFAGGDRKAKLAYRMSKEIASAILPLPIGMTFLFDLDEKNEEEQEQIVAASQGQARFLPVRELENLYLNAEVLTPFLAGLGAHALGRRLSRDDVSKELEALLLAHQDRDLFPEPPPPTADAKQLVRGSAVIDRLTWKYATARYDKRSHGAELAALALKHQPISLDPLRSILESAVP